VIRSFIEDRRNNAIAFEIQFLLLFSYAKDMAEQKKQFNKAAQQAKLLVANPNFQADIKALREKWRIPTDGFKSQTEADEWNGQLMLSSDLMHDEEARKLGLQKLHPADLWAGVAEIDARLPHHLFKADILELIYKYQLSVQWQNNLQEYSLTNAFDERFLFDSVAVSYTRDPQTGLWEIHIIVHENTTLQNVKDSWHLVKGFQKHLPFRKRQKIREIKQLDRDKLAYELDQGGKSYKSIAIALTKEFGKDIDYNEVSKFIERHKKKIGLN